MIKVAGNYFAQERIAADFMRRYLTYAKGIGCTIGEGAAWDEIQCTAEQSAMLAVWWAANTSDIGRHPDARRDQEMA